MSGSESHIKICNITLPCWPTTLGRLASGSGQTTSGRQASASGLCLGLIFRPEAEAGWPDIVIVGPEAKVGRPRVVVVPEAEAGRLDVVFGPEAEAGRPDVVIPEIFGPEAEAARPDVVVGPDIFRPKSSNRT